MVVRHGIWCVETSRGVLCGPACSTPAVPLLPEESEGPADREAKKRPRKRCLRHDPDECPQPPGGIQPPNAADDEQPILSAAHERRKDPGPDREPRGNVLAAAAVERL